MKTSSVKRNRIGLTKVELVIVLAVVAVLLALLIPSLAHGKRHLPAQRCQNNLKIVALVYRIWANDYNFFPWEVSTNDGGTKEWLEAGLAHLHYRKLSNELGSPKILACRDDRMTTDTNSFDKLNSGNISYLVGTSAREKDPNSLLAGERHLRLDGQPLSGTVPLTAGPKYQWDSEIHGGYGAVALADGSAHRTRAKDLQRLLKNSGLATNWIVLPR